MSINLYDIELSARARHQDLLREAEQQRLVKKVRAGRPRKGAAISVAAIGARIRQLFRHPAPQQPAPCVQVSC